MLDFCWSIHYRQSHAPFLPFAIPNGQVLGKEEERVCILLLLCRQVLRQVLEKLILNTYQSNPNQDVVLLTARRLHPSSTSGLEDGRNVPFPLSGVCWSWPTETCRDGLWGEAVEDQGWTGRHRESGWHRRLHVPMSNSSGYVPKPV